MLLIALALGMVVGLSLLSGNAGGGDSIPYSQFQQLLNDGKIKQVTVSGELIRGTFTEKLPDGRTGFTTIQVPQDLSAELQKRGVEYSAVDSSRYGVDLRAGYVLERSPFPVQSGATNFVDNTRHSMSLGAGLGFRDLEPTLDGSVRIDAHFLYA